MVDLEYNPTKPIFKLNEEEVEIHIEELISFFKGYGIIVEKQDVEIHHDTLSLSFTSLEYNGSAKPDTLSKIESILTNNELIDFVVIDTNLYFIHVTFVDEYIAIY